MILLLGKNDLVERYAKEVLKVDIRYDLCYYPNYTSHYTEYENYIKIAKEEKPPVITTQNKEMLEILLNSDLDFAVITVFDGLISRKVTKEVAKEMHYSLDVSLR